MGTGKILQAWAAYLLLPFDQERHTTGQRPINFAPRPDSPETRYQVTLVVGNTSSIKAAILNGPIKRRYTPGLQWLWWLDIIVIVDCEATRSTPGEAPYYHGKALSRYQRSIGA